MTRDATARTRARVEKIYAAYLAGRMPEVMDALAEDVRWMSGETADVAPWCGERFGRAGVRDYFAALEAECRILDYRIRRFIVDGDWAAVTATIRVQLLRTGVEREFDKVDVLHLRDGQIAEFREYYDTGALLGPRPA